MNLNVPTNTLGIGSMQVSFMGGAFASPDGTLTSEEWTIFLTLIAAFAPPPLGSKGATGATGPTGATGATSGS